ncbi:hypothetical protein IQ260_24760 [Leptolyngbya cf. ectocarpi LEGE 11479]|uniref:Uncharacterized protein n=1 Tax=Leptolyngbya cf. ectocarpi LEGE 11479 TaxID=1828722 RepID=A0A928ZYI8_LEPEC|nr:hypothetical protein [Leptolyngbya ectocarpi]MBE9069859.1 hypothetical protein [Leptolyngbya cf. ectocarpi LEGE 11479]
MIESNGDKGYAKIVDERFGYDPFEVLESGNQELTPKGKNAFWDAISAFKFRGPEPLIRMLNSGKKYVVIRALQVFSELGHPGVVLVDMAIERIDLDDAAAKYYILDGALSHLGSLSDRQIARLLSLSEESYANLRKRYITLLTLLETSTIRNALPFLDKKKDLQFHEKGVQLLENAPSIEVLLHQAKSESKILSAYAYAALLNLINTDVVNDLPATFGGGEEHDFLRFKLAQRQKKTRSRS